MHQKNLFAWEHYTEQDVRLAIGAIESQLREFIWNSWTELERLRRREPAFRNLPPGGMSQWLHYQVVAAVKAAFPECDPNGEDSVGWAVDDNGMFHLEYKFVELTFKKLDRDFQRSNYLTAANLRYWRQQLLPGFPPIIKVIVGYQWADETATSLSRVVVACPAEVGAQWWYELPAPAQVVKPVALAPNPEEGIGGDKKGFRVKSKKKKAGEGNDGLKTAE
jgi:hypothetical protein